MIVKIELLPGERGKIRAAFDDCEAAHSRQPIRDSAEWLIETARQTPRIRST